MWRVVARIEIVMATAGACGRHSARCYLGRAVMADSDLE